MDIKNYHINESTKGNYFNNSYNKDEISRSLKKYLIENKLYLKGKNFSSPWLRTSKSVKKNWNKNKNISEAIKE
jgi:hypothetical protein